MQVNYKLVLIILISAALGSSIAVAVIYIPRKVSDSKNVDEASEVSAEQVEEAAQYPPTHVGHLRRAPVYHLKNQADLVQDQRDFDISKIRGSKKVVPFKFPDVDVIAKNAFANDDIQVTKLEVAGQANAVKYSFQVNDKDAKLLGIVEVGQWEVGIVPSSIERVVTYQPNDAANKNLPSVQIIDFFIDAKSNVSQFVFEKNAWNIVINTDNK